MQKIIFWNMRCFQERNWRNFFMVVVKKRSTRLLVEILSTCDSFTFFRCSQTHQNLAYQVTFQHFNANFFLKTGGCGTYSTHVEISRMMKGSRNHALHLKCHISPKHQREEVCALELIFLFLQTLNILKDLNSANE